MIIWQVFWDLLYFYPSSAMKTSCFHTISFSFEKVDEILIYQQKQLHL